MFAAPAHAHPPVAVLLRANRIPTALPPTIDYRSHGQGYLVLEARRPCRGAQECVGGYPPHPPLPFFAASGGPDCPDTPCAVWPDPACTSASRGGPCRRPSTRPLAQALVQVQSLPAQSLRRGPDCSDTLCGVRPDPVISLCVSVSRDAGRANEDSSDFGHAPEGIQRARFLATPLPHRPSLACSLLDNGLLRAPPSKHPTPPPNRMTSHVMTPQGQAKARTREHPHPKKEEDAP